MAVGEQPAHANRPVAKGVSDDQLPGTLKEQSRGRCGEGEPSPSADVAGVNPVPEVAGASPVPVQMWQAWDQSRCRCGRGAPSRRCGRG